MGSWNEAKEAAGLETFTQSEGRNPPIQPKPDGVDIPTDSEWTELSPQQRWYYKNREHRIAVKTRRRKELQRWLYEYKRDKCRCERCGEGFPGALDFHHVGAKEDDVSMMVTHGYSRKRINAEIDRCVVLCANCHQKEHYEPPLRPVPDVPRNEEVREGLSDDQRWNHPPLDVEGKRRRRTALRVWVYQYKQASDGCNRCDESDPACLEFHHVEGDDDAISVSTLIAYGPSKGRLIEEIEKCELLCRNCHREEHYEVPEREGRGSTA